MEKETPSVSRRHLVLKGLGLLALASAFRLPFFGKKERISCAPPSRGKTVKMLSQDGTLVEVDEKLLSSSRQKATNEQLKNWISKR
jgi:hypothetical protein